MRVRPEIKAVRRLAYLSDMLSKYSHRWNGNESPSSRMCDWVDEYNDLKESDPKAWRMYCKDFDRDPGHDAYDLFA